MAALGRILLSDPSSLNVYDCPRPTSAPLPPRPSFLPLSSQSQTASEPSSSPGKSPAASHRGRSGSGAGMGRVDFPTEYDERDLDEGPSRRANSAVGKHRHRSISVVSPGESGRKQVGYMQDAKAAAVTRDSELGVGGIEDISESQWDQVVIQRGESSRRSNRMITPRRGGSAQFAHHGDSYAKPSRAGSVTMDLEEDFETELGALEADIRRYAKRDEGRKRRRGSSELRQDALSSLQARRRSRSIRSESASMTRGGGRAQSTNARPDGDEDAYDPDMIDDGTLVQASSPAAREDPDEDVGESGGSDDEDEGSDEEDFGVESSASDSAVESGSESGSEDRSRTRDGRKQRPSKRRTRASVGITMSDEEGEEIQDEGEDIQPDAEVAPPMGLVSSDSGLGSPPSSSLITPKLAPVSHPARTPRLRELPKAADAGNKKLPVFLPSSPLQGGGPGPSSARSFRSRSRSTARSAALVAREKTKKFVVLSDDEDGDYDPSKGEVGDRAFELGYERALEREMDGDDEEEDSGAEYYEDDGGPEEDGEGEVLDLDLGGAGEGDDEDDDFVMLGSQLPVDFPPPVTGDGRVSAHPHTDPGELEAPEALHSLEDDFDSLPTDGLDAIDLDGIGPPQPPSSTQKAIPRQAPGLADLFSSKSPRKASTSPLAFTARTRVSELPNTSRPTGLTPTSSAAAARRAAITASAASTDAASAGPSHRPSTVLTHLDANADISFYEPNPGAFMPVSQMPSRWRDFYMNHWRRGAVGVPAAPRMPAASKRLQEDDEFSDPPAPKRSAGKSSTASASARVRGGARAKSSRGRVKKAPARQLVLDGNDDGVSGVWGEGSDDEIGPGPQSPKGGGGGARWSRGGRKFSRGGKGGRGGKRGGGRGGLSRRR